MKIRKEPKIPTVQEFSTQYEDKPIHGFNPYYANKNIGELIKLLEKVQKDYPEGHIHFELDYSGCCYEGDRPSMSLMVKYPIFAKDQFEAAMVKYHAQRKSYDQWYAENKDQIVEELENRRKYAEEIKRLNKKFKRT